MTTSFKDFCEMYKTGGLSDTRRKRWDSLDSQRGLLRRRIDLLKAKGRATADLEKRLRQLEDDSMDA